MKYIGYSVIIICTLALAGCGVTSSANASGGSNTSPPTSSIGAIVIATDHSDYAPTDAISITLTNDIGQAIYAFDERASCSVLSLEIFSGDQWQDVAMLSKPIAGCAMKRVSLAVKIANGTTYRTHVYAGYFRQGDAVFPAAMYRLRLEYTTTPLQNPVGNPTATYTSIYSQSLTISASVPAQPIPTIVPPTTGQGTSVAGTAVPAGTTQP